MIDHLYVLALKAWLEQEQSGACEVNPSKVKKICCDQQNFGFGIWMDFCWRTSGIISLYLILTRLFVLIHLQRFCICLEKHVAGHDLVPKKNLLTKLPGTAVPPWRLANCRAWQTAMVSQAVFIPWTAPCQPGGNRTHMICMVNHHVPRDIPAYAYEALP